MSIIFIVKTQIELYEGLYARLRGFYAQLWSGSNVDAMSKIVFSFFVTCSHTGDVFCPCHQFGWSDVHAHQKL